MVIETIFNPTNYDEEYDTHLVIDPNISQIEHSVLCLMAGAPRVHRQVLYADLKDIDDNDLVMTIRKSEYADIQ